MLSCQDIALVGSATKNKKKNTGQTVRQYIHCLSVIRISGC